MASRLEFKEARHTYRLDGAPVPGVTTTINRAHGTRWTEKGNTRMTRPECIGAATLNWRWKYSGPRPNRPPVNGR